MRILIHDFGAYPFSIELSRELAKRGHTVRYVYLDESNSVRGDVQQNPADPANYSIVGLADVDPGRRCSFSRRLIHDLCYSRQLVDETRLFAPEVVLSADCPLVSQRALQRLCAESGARFIYWLQDLFGEALEAVVGRQSSVAGSMVSAPFKILEKSLLRRSDEVLAISPSFADYVSNVRSDQGHVHLLPNWAPLTAPSPIKSTWGTTLGLPAGPRMLYAGTLGLKHNPDVLLNIAVSLQDLERPGHLVVVSEGDGREYLETAKDSHGIENLYLVDYQPASALDEMLNSANVLLAILTADSSRFSIPSKILTYLNAGKPVLGVLPPENYSAQILELSGAGKVIAPDNTTQTITAAQQLLSDGRLCNEMGINARLFAERMFGISPIADRIEQICDLIDVTGEIDLAEPQSIPRYIDQPTL